MDSQLSQTVQAVLTKAANDATFRQQLHSDAAATLASLPSELGQLTAAEQDILVKAFTNEPGLGTGEEVDQRDVPGFTGAGAAM